MTNTSTAVASASRFMTMSAVGPDGKQTDHVLEEGASLIIGQGANCGLKLQGDDISPIHCVVQFNEGKLAIQDWCSKTGTLVDGQKVTDEVSVNPGVQIGIGGYTLLTKLGGAAAAAAAADSASNSDSVRQQSSPDAVEPPTAIHPPAAPSAASDANRTRSAPRSILDPLLDDEPEEVEMAVTAPVEPPPTASKIPESPAASSRSPEPPAAAPKSLEPAPAPRRRRLTPEQSFNQETIELLQNELELVQSELAERDGQIAELTALIESGPDVDPAMDNEESKALLGRLEELLDELDRSDQRARALEELLRAEQESSHAEQEERVQMERWLNDIEQRISEREAEALAERDVLVRRIEELKQQLDEADRQICQAASEASPQAAHDGTLQKLREDNDRLSEELVKAQEQQRSLELRIESMQDKSAEENQQEIIEEAIREERMKMAQERATLSRERADLARQIAEMQSAAKTQPAAAADEKFNAFRKTLKELHAEEHRDSAHRKPSLGSRIADLWKRLDGPTDTD